MNRCIYRSYEQVFLMAREALHAGDARALRQLTGAAEDREVRRAMAALLALSDVKRGSPQRPMAQVCRALGDFCSTLGCRDRRAHVAPAAVPRARAAG